MKDGHVHGGYVDSGSYLQSDEVSTKIMPLYFVLLLPSIRGHKSGMVPFMPGSIIGEARYHTGDYVLNNGGLYASTERLISWLDPLVF